MYTNSNIFNTYCARNIIEIRSFLLEILVISALNFFRRHYADKWATALLNPLYVCPLNTLIRLGETRH